MARSMSRHTIEGLRDTLRRRGRRIAALKAEIRALRAADQRRTEALEQLVDTLKNRARYDHTGNIDAAFAVSNAAADLAEIVNRRWT